jgi:hypothetical protein
MCGACGGPPPDPAGALVAGPRRRAAVARAVASACPGLTVRAVPGAWTVSTRTGRTTVCRTLDALVVTAAPHMGAISPAVGGSSEAALVLTALRAAAGQGDAISRQP